MAEIRRPYSDYGLAPRSSALYGLGRRPPYSMIGKYAHTRPGRPDNPSGNVRSERLGQKSTVQESSTGAQDTGPVYMRPVMGLPLRMFSSQRRAEYRRGR